MKRILLILAAACLAATSGAQKRAFTLSDLYRIRSVEDPQISPDGKRIAFVVREDHLSEGTSGAAIYLMDAGGGNQRRLTPGTASDTHPRWSPDGSSLLFLSTRAGGAQAWVLPLNGGEPTQMTDFAAGVGDPEWTRDGEGIVFDSDVYPECGADNECNKQTQESWSGGPLSAHMADGLLYRHWTSWRDGKRTHILLYRRSTGTYADLTPGDVDSPPFSLGGVGFALSPDGKEIAFVSERDGLDATTTNKDVWTVQTAGGEARNLTPANRAYDGDPAYSNDGRYIAFRTQKVPGYESDRFRIALYDRKTGAQKVITENFDNWVDEIGWAPDGASIYFTADVGGRVPLYRLNIASGALTKVYETGMIDAFAISPDGSTAVFVRRTVGEPREIWSVPTGGGTAVRLTSFNQALADTVDIRPASEIWIPSPTGRKIHTFIVTPHGFDPAKKYPLIVNVHGGPQMQWADAFRGDWQVYPGSGYIVAFPNPTGSTGYGQEFTKEISRDWGGKVFRDIMAVTDSLAKLPYVDPSRIGAMGWSYGGTMMMWLEGHTSRFRAIASMMGVYDFPAMHGATEELWFPEYELGGKPWTSNLYDRLSPNRYVRNFKTPCLVITGERDYRVPYTQSLEFFTDLQEMHVPSRLIVFANDGHWPSNVKSMPLYYNAHLDWFHRYLGGDAAPYDMTKMLRNEALKSK
ncbi:MAG TPA: S9 family peptidase [Bacteroidota bacterium]|nr:S9 family peptidase [Bacteroidota bacterium]